MQGGEDQMSGQRRLDGNLRRLAIADFKILADKHIAASITTKVALNSHCRFLTPPVMPMVSRTGRSMK